MYILQECGNYQFNDYQFGFVSNHSTNMAVTLANDVASYFVNNGSQLFMCGLSKPVFIQKGTRQGLHERSSQLHFLF